MAKSQTLKKICTFCVDLPCSLKVAQELSLHSLCPSYLYKKMHYLLLQGHTLTIFTPCLKKRVALEMTEKDYKQSTIGALEIGLLNFVSLYLIYTYLI